MGGGRLAHVAALAALLAGAAPAHAAVDRTVDASALRAVVSADPWHVRFVDAAGRTVLEEGGPGLGFTSTTRRRACCASRGGRGLGASSSRRHERRAADRLPRPGSVAS